MASTHIEIPSTASRLSADVRGLIDQMRDVQERALKVKDIIDQIASGGDWASLAAYLGVTAGQAEIVYNLITAAIDDVQGADYNAVIDRLG